MVVITDNPLLNSQQTINPYYNAISLLKRRLVWDLNPESWISRGKLTKLRDKYKGQKAVIICNGPSLLKSDLSSLTSNGIFTFGLNKINLLFDKSDFRPSCIAAVNSLVIEQNRAFYNTTDIPLFLDSCALKFVKPKENIAFLHKFGSREVSFARDCSISISQGATVTFVALQLAFHLGFQEVALIGCDHNFSTKGPAHATAISEEKDVNHFDPNYFAGGVKWHLPDLPMSEAFYSVAYEVYSAFGRKLVNATEGGSLDLFPRVDLKQFVS